MCYPSLLHRHYSAPSYNRGTVYYTTIDPDCYAAPNRYIEAPKYYTIEVNYNVVLLSDIVVSLMAGSTTSLPMSFEHEYQTAMPTPCYTTTAYASAGYYTIKAPGNYTTTYYVQSYYTDALRYYTDSLNCVPIPISDVNLQKDRPVCFEGHGNHYDTDISWVSITDTATTAVDYLYQLASSSHYQLATIVNYNVVLLSDIVVSLMAGSTTSLPMSFEHEYQSAMPTPYYTTTAYASAGYYTIKSPGNYTTTYDPTSYCTDALPIPISDVNLQKDRPVCFEGHGNHYHYSAPSYNRGTVYYTNIDPDCYAAPNRYIEAPKYYTIEDYYDVMLLLGVVSLMAGSMTISTHYIDACKYHISKATRVIYTNIYASSSYCTEVSLYPKSHQQNEYYTGDLKYYTTKATKYCTTSYAVLGCYTDVSKYCSDYRQYTEAAAY
ncbi:hypothetical protein DAPPUDRAFT_232281 [Daphnia pulex]|uniref:Uncharacterized protein n=1 Tax=Daphnia pulex TaxID=6669 RepID=E9FS94_DAPPU|nr:hypothetical protein DAPPUDRAFT_232281 [Daphnia pulex]|eukprot:EFX90362.1 hypothetical protein DAPPUDRAFT_232281 [Daphnia pulex]